MTRIEKVGEDDPLFVKLHEIFERTNAGFMLEIGGISLGRDDRHKIAGMSASLFIAEGIAALISVGASRADVEKYIAEIIKGVLPDRMN